MATIYVPNRIPRFQIRAAAALAENGVYEASHNMLQQDIGGSLRGPFTWWSYWLYWSPGATPVDGLQVEIFGAQQQPDLTINGSDDVAFYADRPVVPQSELDHTGGGSTTLAAAGSTGSNLIQVASPTGFAIGQNIFVVDGGTVPHLHYIVDILTSPDRLQLDRNADANYAITTTVVRTARSAQYEIPIRGELALKLRCTNLDGGAGDNSWLAVDGSAIEGYKAVNV